MKLKSCFLFLCMSLVMLACSSDDDAMKQSQTPDSEATLTLSVQASGRVNDTDDGIESNTKDGTMTSLVLLIFRNHADNDTEKEFIHKSEVIKNNTLEKIVEFKDIKLGAENIRILLVANLLDSEYEKLLACKTWSEAQSVATLLENEEEYTGAGKKGLTMSAFKDVMLHPGENRTEIALERVAARVELHSLTLASSNEYKSSSFQLKEVFLTNVKSEGFVSGDAEAVCSPQDGDDSGACSVPDFFYLTGDQDDNFADGKYKTGKEKYTDLIRSVLTNCKLELGDAVTEKMDKAKLGGYGNKYFYVYPNKVGETKEAGKWNHTLLVLKGDYTHNMNGIDKVEKDRYYMVVVNDKDFSTEGDGEHIKRNTKYWIDLTITGSGSAKPYDPAAFTHVSAQVKVTDWSIKDIVANVD